MEFNAVPTLNHHPMSSSKLRGGAAVGAERKKKPLQPCTPLSTRQPRVGGWAASSNGSASPSVDSSSVKKRWASPIGPAPAASDHPQQAVSMTTSGAGLSSPPFTVGGQRCLGAPEISSACRSDDDEHFEPCLSVQRPRFAELAESGCRQVPNSAASPLRSAGRSLPPLAPAAAGTAPLSSPHKPPLHTSPPQNVRRSLLGEDFIERSEVEETSGMPASATTFLLPVPDEMAPTPHPQLVPLRPQALLPRPAIHAPPQPTPRLSCATASLATVDVEHSPSRMHRHLLVPDETLVHPSAPTSDNEGGDSGFETPRSVENQEGMHPEAGDESSGVNPASCADAAPAAVRRAVARETATLLHLPAPSTADPLASLATSEPSAPLAVTSKPQPPLRRGAPLAQRHFVDSSIPASVLPTIGEQPQDELRIVALKACAVKPSSASPMGDINEHVQDDGRLANTAASADAITTQQSAGVEELRGASIASSSSSSCNAATSTDDLNASLAALPAHNNGGGARGRGRVPPQEPYLVREPILALVNASLIVTPVATRQWPVSQATTPPADAQKAAATEEIVAAVAEGTGSVPEPAAMIALDVLEHAATSSSSSSSSHRFATPVSDVTLTEVDQRQRPPTAAAGDVSSSNPPVQCAVASPSQHEGSHDGSFDGLQASMRSDDAESPFEHHSTDRNASNAGKSPQKDTDVVERVLQNCFEEIRRSSEEQQQQHSNPAPSQLRQHAPVPATKDVAVRRREASIRRGASPLAEPANSTVGAARPVSSPRSTIIGGARSTSINFQRGDRRASASPRHSFQFSEPPLFAEGSSPTSSLAAVRTPRRGATTDCSPPLMVYEDAGPPPSFSPENVSPEQQEEEGRPPQPLVEADGQQHANHNASPPRGTSASLPRSEGGGVSAADRSALEEHLQALEAAAEQTSQKDDAILFSFPHCREQQQLRMQQQRSDSLRPMVVVVTRRTKENDEECSDDESNDDLDGTRMADVSINISLAPTLYCNPAAPPISIPQHDNRSPHQHLAAAGDAMDVFFGPSAHHKASAVVPSVSPAQPIVQLRRHRSSVNNTPTTAMLLSPLCGEASASRDDDVDFLNAASHAALPKAVVVGRNATGCSPTVASSPPPPATNGNRGSAVVYCGSSTSGVALVVGAHAASGLALAAQLEAPPVHPSLHQDIALVDSRAISEEWREGLRQFEEDVPVDFVNDFPLGGNHHQHHRGPTTTLPSIVVGRKAEYDFTSSALYRAEEEDAPVVPKPSTISPERSRNNDPSIVLDWITPPPRVVGGRKTESGGASGAQVPVPRRIAHVTTQPSSVDHTQQRRQRVLQAVVGSSTNNSPPVVVGDDANITQRAVLPAEENTHQIYFTIPSVPPSPLRSSEPQPLDCPMDGSASPSIRVPRGYPPTDSERDAQHHQLASCTTHGTHNVTTSSTAATSSFSTSGPHFLLDHLLETQQHHQQERQRAKAIVSPAEDGAAAPLVSTLKKDDAQAKSSVPLTTFEELAARRRDMRLKSIHSALSAIERDRAKADERHRRRSSPHDELLHHRVGTSSNSEALVVPQQRNGGGGGVTTVLPSLPGATAAATPSPSPGWMPRLEEPVVDPTLFARNMRNIIMGLKSSVLPPTTLLGSETVHQPTVEPHSFVVTGFDEEEGEA